MLETFIGSFDDPTELKRHEVTYWLHQAACHQLFRECGWPIKARDLDAYQALESTLEDLEEFRGFHWKLYEGLFGGLHPARLAGELLTADIANPEDLLRAWKDFGEPTSSTRRLAQGALARLLLRQSQPKTDSALL